VWNREEHHIPSFKRPPETEVLIDPGVAQENDRVLFAC
jgi:hypothetical protein